MGVVINGVRWATRNVDMPGTFAKTPESSGMLFQWDIKKAFNAVDELVEDDWQRWMISLGKEGKWSAENDPCPTGWRIPTHEELELLYNTHSEWTTQNNVNGRFFGIAPYQIFLPAVGFRETAWQGSDDYGFDIFAGKLKFAGKGGYYWSQTSMGRGSPVAWCLWFGKHFDTGREFLEVHYNWLSFGFNIRCVAL